MRRSVDELGFPLDSSRVLRVELSNATRVRVQATLETGTWGSSTAIELYPVVGGIRGVFGSTYILDTGQRTQTIPSSELAGVTAIDIVRGTAHPASNTSVRLTIAIDDDQTEPGGIGKA